MGMSSGGHGVHLLVLLIACSTGLNLHGIDRLLILSLGFGTGRGCEQRGGKGTAGTRAQGRRLLLCTCCFAFTVCSAVRGWVGMASESPQIAAGLGHRAQAAVRAASSK